MFERYSDRARVLIFMSAWSARNRGASYIEPGDLLHALIRQDRGEFTALSAEVFPGAPARLEKPAGGHRRFFEDDLARNLLRELHEDAEPLNAETRRGKRESVPHVDIPISNSLKHVLGLVAKTHLNDSVTIEPIHLLAAITEDRDSRLAQLLRDHGVTRQEVAKALDS